MGMVYSILREIFSDQIISRQPEKMVMNQKQQAEEFFKFGQGDTPLKTMYLFHSQFASRSLKNCKTVIDLGCGAANQLIYLAKLNPTIEFTGVDLSDEMLELADKNIKDQTVKNVKLIEADLTNLKYFKDNSFDGAFSSVALHHLENSDQLEQCFKALSRVLKKDYSIYITDFMQLKNPKSIDFLLNLNGEQPEIFKDDYKNSLLAAFDSNIFNELTLKYLPHSTLYSTYFTKFLGIIKTPSKNEDKIQKEFIKNQLKTLSPHNQRLYYFLKFLF